MSFASGVLTAGILIKVELPSGTIRVCDGGVALFNGEGDDATHIYRSEDSRFGTIAGADALTEGIGSEVPATALTFLPNGNEASEALTSPDMQFSPVSIWLIEKDPVSGVTINQELFFKGVVDVPTFREGSEGRLIDMRLVALSELFFQGNDGNRLSEENHKRIHPGERGLDNMTGVEIEVPWGTETRPRNSGTTGASSLGSGSSSDFSQAFRF